MYVGRRSKSDEYQASSAIVAVPICGSEQDLSLRVKLSVFTKSASQYSPMVTR